MRSHRILLLNNILFCFHWENNDNIINFCCCCCCCCFLFHPCNLAQMDQLKRTSIILVIIITIKMITVYKRAHESVRIIKYCIVWKCKHRESMKSAIHDSFVGAQIAQWSRSKLSVTQLSWNMCLQLNIIMPSDNRFGFLSFTPIMLRWHMQQFVSVYTGSAFFCCVINLLCTSK
jgi:hypothetical protein